MAFVRQRGSRIVGRSRRQRGASLAACGAHGGVEARSGHAEQAEAENSAAQDDGRAEGALRADGCPCASRGVSPRLTPPRSSPPRLDTASDGRVPINVARPSPRLWTGSQGVENAPFEPRRKPLGCPSGCLAGRTNRHSRRGSGRSWKRPLRSAPCSGGRRKTPADQHLTDGACHFNRLVRTAGLEPAQPWGRKILSLVRLPIPPRPHRRSGSGPAGADQAGGRQP